VEEKGVLLGEQRSIGRAGYGDVWVEGVVGRERGFRRLVVHWKTQ
jgi:hypothetical protein